MKKGVEARRELISRAAELFDKYGYDSVSIKDIADSLGWTKSLFYYYCPSKEELVCIAAQTRADELIDGMRARLDGFSGDSVQKLGLALDYAGFWAQCEPAFAAERLRRLFLPGSLPWRAHLRAIIAPKLGSICNDIIAAGVKDYEMYTPYSGVMGEVVVALTADLSEKLAALLLAGDSDCIERAEGLLEAYRCAVERLMEAPFGSLRLVELDFLRDTAQALKCDAENTGGDIQDEIHEDNNDDADCGDTDADDGGVGDGE